MPTKNPVIVIPEKELEKRVAVKTGGSSPNAKPFNATSLKARIEERKKQGLK